MSITDPDNRAISYSYPTTTSRLVASRTDKRGTRNTYSYTTTGNRLAGVIADVGTGRLNIATGFTPAETRGLKVGTAAGSALTPVALTDVLTAMVGPRADTTRIWTDRWGAPTAVRNALGQETKLLRGDIRFPALVTEVRAPNGFTTSAAFDAHGAPIRTTEVNPYGDGRDATTTYQYGTVHAFLPTRVTQPAGDYVATTYFPDGNVNNVQDGRGPQSGVTFTYEGTDGCVGLPKVVSRASYGSVVGARSTYQYDPHCNLSEGISPVGATTTYFRNAFGRVDSIFLPIDATGRHETQRFQYDAMGRDTLTTRVGPAMGKTVAIGSEAYNGAESLVVRKKYNESGFLVAVRADGTLRDSTEYDALGRATKMIVYDPHYAIPEGRDTTYRGYSITSTHYDVAGNPDSVRYGDGPTVAMVYDKLNRMTQQIVPQVTFPITGWCYADCFGNLQGTYFPAFYQDANDSLQLNIPAETTTFTYDAVSGGMRRATNSYTRIGRDYYPNGALRGDTLFVQGKTPLTYSLWNVYDLNGRRTELYTNGATVPQKFIYDSTSGALTRILDTQGKPYSFTYNAESQLIGVLLPNGVQESYGYDKEDRILWRTGSGGKGVVNDLLRLSMNYDYRGKILHSEEAIHELFPQRGYEGNFSYSGLGYLMSVERTAPLIKPEAYLVAPDGYVTASRNGAPDDVDAWTYYGAGHRSGQMPDPPDTCVEIQRCEGAGHDEYTWASTSPVFEKRDAAGNEVDVETITYSYYYEADAAYKPEIVQEVANRARTMSWYGADRKLRFVQRTEVGGYFDHCESGRGCQISTPGEKDGEFIEYRYDALGRRVYADIQRGNPEICREGCNNLREFYIWDGDRMIFEKQVTDELTITEITTEKSNWRVGWLTGLNHEEWKTVTYPGFGVTIQYTHGLGIDQPLSLYRSVTGDSTSLVWVRMYDPNDTTDPFDRFSEGVGQGYWEEVTIPRTGAPQLIGPHRNAQGLVFMATDAKGERCCYVEVYQDGKVVKDQTVFFPGDADLTATMSSAGLPPVYNRLFQWYGSLVTNSTDPNGLMYMRNRYYNPESGQFTQPDPIGIAGGLNVYGYAAGDPVNFNDPFGLGPCEINEQSEACLNVRRLIELQDEVIARPDFQPTDITHCNQATYCVAKGMGTTVGLEDSRGSALLANQMGENLAAGISSYMEVDSSRAQRYANAGMLVIVTGPGHVATVRPDIYPEGTYPGRGILLANVGRLNGVMRLSKVFRESDWVKIRYYMAIQ
jgi:RHS repeat-associated protein